MTERDRQGRGAGGRGGGGATKRRRPAAGPAWRTDRRWQAGLLIGSAIGAAVAVAGRHAERSARRGLVDWPGVERAAIKRLQRAPGTLTAAELAAVEDDYRAAMAVIVPRLSDALGVELPGVAERAAVVDRAGWVRANVTSFARIVEKIEDDLLDQIVPIGGGLGRAAIALANRFVTTQQLGFLLGFMGTKVLGQYDLALLASSSSDGRVLFVEENIRMTARALGVPVGPFRTWIALHETAHAFEFEAHPWLRPYMADRLERQLALLSRDTTLLGRDGLRGLGRALRREKGGDHWMERLMGEEQRTLFRETQAVMSLIEGFSDYIMDEVGREIVPDVERISERFHARREQRTPFERAVMRLTGLDLKVEQYKKGERFVRAIAEVGGREALATLWRGPDTLPTPAEIEDPAAWRARVLDGGTA